MTSRSAKKREADEAATRALQRIVTETMCVLQHKTDRAEGAMYARLALASSAEELAKLVVECDARPSAREALRSHVEDIFPELASGVRGLASRVVNLRDALATANDALGQIGMIQRIANWISGFLNRDNVRAAKAEVVDLDDIPRILRVIDNTASFGEVAYDRLAEDLEIEVEDFHKSQIIETLKTRIRNQPRLFELPLKGEAGDES